MKTIFKLNVITLMSVILITVILVIAVILVLFGRAYQSKLNTLQSDKPNNIETVKTKKTKKITIRRPDNTGCISITPDGIVEVYEVCNEDPNQIFRSTSTRSLDRLFRLISESKFTRVKTEGSYEITVHTDDGDITVYIPIGNNPDLTGDIDDLIDDIIAGGPEPSQTPTIPVYITSTPTLPPGVTPTVTPTPIFIPYLSPTPNQTETDTMFTCDFENINSDKKPYRVSNVVCTSEPAPAE